ncbi:MAG: hypothetical protein L0Y72_02035 [Gemmataceae bacterium]|nr:hypothetical protein [Gemmataceae bacterium]MCI0737796.1 hypothetical protein [Gemmataceae bacterium]
MSKHIVVLTAGLLVLALAVASRGGDADAKDMVAKAIKASGGEAKVASLKTGNCKATANVQDGNMQFTATLNATWQGWDQYRMTVAADIGGKSKNMLVVINGDKGWAKDLDSGKVEEAPKDTVPMITGMLSAMRMPHMLSALLDKEVKLSPLGEVKVGDHVTLGLTVARKERTEVRLFFDKETGLVAKSEIQLTDPRGQEKMFEFLYHDYKETGGLKLPMRVLTKVDKSEVVLDVSEVKAQEKVDPGQFAAPE